MANCGDDGVDSRRCTRRRPSSPTRRVGIPRPTFHHRYVHPILYQWYTSHHLLGVIRFKSDSRKVFFFCSLRVVSHADTARGSYRSTIGRRLHAGACKRLRRHQEGHRARVAKAHGHKPKKSVARTYHHMLEMHQSNRWRQNLIKGTRNDCVFVFTNVGRRGKHHAISVVSVATRPAFSVYLRFFMLCYLGVSGLFSVNRELEAVVYYGGP